MAIEQAITILSWHENLQEDEVPPEYLWEDPQGLEMWWKTVEAKREDGMSIRGRGDSSDDAGEDTGPGQAENDLARYLKQG